MLRELNISDSTFDQLIRPHKDFLNTVGENEQIEWSEILMRKHPELLAFRTKVHKLTKTSDVASARVYMLSTARTFLTCRYLLESTDKSIIIGRNEVEEYTNTMVQELQCFIRQQPHDPITDIELHAQTQFLINGAYPPSAVSWMANFFNGNVDLAVHFLLPEKSYPAESERYMYRGIMDIAHPIENALRRKAEDQFVDKRLLRMKT